MGYSEEFFKAVEERKKKREEELKGDIAPLAPSFVNSTTYDFSAPTATAGGNKDSIFKSGGFSDGVDGVGDFFGDLGQTVLGTVGDISLGITRGLGGLVEGVTDLATYGVAGVADLFGADEFADQAKQMAQENHVRNWTQDAVDYVDQYSILGNKSDAVSEGLGQVAGIILTGGLGNAAGLGVKGASALTQGTLFASSMGSGMGEAYSSGASDEQAFAYGATSGAIETISEMIFGGLGKGAQALGLGRGLSSLDDVVARKVSNTAARFITSETGGRVVGNILELAVKSGAEGLEEVLAGFGSAIAKDAILLNGENEKAFSEILKDEKLLEQFVVGSIVSGIAQGGDFISSTESGRDLVSGLSANEQKVLDKVFEQRLAEESENRTLSNREKNKLYERVTEEMKRGYIDTDTIESILGGESYKGYQNLTAQETSLNERKKAIEDEIKILVRTPESQFTVEQRERLNSLREEAKSIKEQIKGLDTKTAKRNLFDEVDRLTANDTFLRESYNQREKRGQAFTADLIKYKGKQREAVQRAIDSGVLNDTYRSHELVDTLSRIEAEKGIVFDYANNKKLAQSGMALNGKTINGFEKDGVVTLNVQSSKAWQSTVGHEITHVLEGTEAYSALQQALVEYAKSKGDYQGRYDSLVELYKGVKGYETDFEAKIQKELTADLVGDYLFSDKAFVDRLVGNRTLFQKVWDEVKYLCKVATGKELTEIEKVNREFDRAWKERGQVAKESESGEILLSISKDIANSDHSWYNEIRLPVAEQERVQSEALTWNADRRNQLITQTLSNEITYRYMIDDDGIVHIYEREAAVNIHEREQEYDNANGEELDSAIEELWTGQGDNSIDSGLSQDGRKPGKDDTNDYRFVSGEGRSDGTGYSKDRANAYGRPKKRSWHFNEDGSVDVTYSDGTQKKEDIAHKKKVSSTDDTFFDGENTDTRFSLSKSVEETKQKQFDIIQATNPMWDDYHVGIRSVDDIRTWEEVLALDDEREGQFVWGDFSREDAEQALEDNSITVYSSYPIKNGTFVSTSYVQAREYAGGKNGKVYSKTIPLSDVAWINGDEGQYARPSENNIAPVGTQHSLSNKGEEFAPTGNYSTPLSETALEQDIAPVAEVVAENATATVGDTTATNTGDDAPAEQTVEEKISAKQKNLQTELDNNIRLRSESNADFDAEIARLRSEYEAKKNKNTKAANDILRRIERIQRLKNNVDADYEKRITTLRERIQKMQTPQYRRGEQRRAKQAKWTSEIREMIGDTSTWRDRKLGISYQTNTLRRNLRAVVLGADGKPDIAKADSIYEYLQGSYNHNEAQLKRESVGIKKPFADMKINKHESAYIQMLGEFKYNPDTKLTLEAVDEYFNKHKDRIDLDKVNRAIDESRKVYDDLFKRINAVLREMGLKELGYREGYFPHFTEPKQSWLGKLLNWKTIDTEIPTDIAGLTEEFNPVRSYQSYDKHRKGDDTDYDFLKGFDTYVHGALDWIYHIEDIQKRRAFENEIRYSHSEQGIRDRVDEIRKMEDLDADEVQELLDGVYRQAKNPLNNFVTDLRNSTNALAGKKSTVDREMEYATNRKVYSTMTNISNRVSANMVVGSVSSALTNFIPITQSWGQVSPVSSLAAMGDMIRNAYRDDGMIRKSDFMTNRLIEEEQLSQTGWDKASRVAGGLMNIFDHISTEVVWRSKFKENMNNGMSESEAIHDADIFAENVMAGRSRGNMPTIYNSKNPLVKMLTAFQLEVGNQYGYMFKDMPQDIGKENIGKLTAGYAKMFIGAYVYNALFSKLAGRDAAFDPIGIIEDLLKDIGFGGDDEEEEVDVLGAVQGFGENIVQELPYVGGLLGGGRVPISSALPYDSITEMVTGTMTDIADKDWANLTNEWLNPVYYLALPFGGGQLKKTNEGLGMFSDDHPVSGSYTASGNLRFPVEDTPLNRLQAGLFGQYASENAREYFDEGYAPLKEKQIQEYMDVDIPIKDYWKYREGLSKQETLEDKFDYIADLDLPVEKKNILINNIVDREDKVDLENYDDFASLEEFDFATNHPDRYALSKSVGGYSAYQTYQKALSDIKSDKDEFGKTITGSRKEKVLQYINGLNADYETKIILYKSEYPSDDTYNAEIINYVNNRSDLTYEERVSILTELGFRVVNGNIYAD